MWRLGNQQQQQQHGRWHDQQQPSFASPPISLTRIEMTPSPHHSWNVPFVVGYLEIFFPAPSFLMPFLLFADIGLAFVYKYKTSSMPYRGHAINLHLLP
ncbi:hypothetical protein L249_0397 [Ophiocordyceps polyrhachis-furcata BCC 54312]|uniref:Uncharacterized protein n=1 Tax=Ophiocordyceps polyrhachis-furcata BCC 54312 TaxID=1330021 RepID=A0A367LEG9_9HYPO|nr:hypothetical protein L249_0397 [Ophiocordyceps polyrhachis-furcata BCC 54312]